MTETYKMLIAGKLVDSASGQYIEVKNPATAEVIGRVPRAGQEEVSSASESSAEAFETWQSLPAAERGKIMHQMAEALRQNAGELCNRVNRIYVEEEIAEELKRRLVDKAEKIVVGNGLEEGVDMGPLLAERFFNKVHGQVIDAKEKGAKILTGGERLRGEKYAKGFFYPPTLVADVNHQMRLMQEETFGPVIGIMTFTDEAEAVRLANDTVYGLSAFVFSRDLKRAWEVMRRLEAGSVWINDIHGSYIHCPYGGMKESGLGREQSSKAVEEYLEEKTVYLDLSKENRGGYLMVH